MNTDGVCLNWNILTCNSCNFFLFYHPYYTGNCQIFVCDHGPFLTAVYKRTIFLICTVCKNLQSRTKSHVFCRTDKFSTGQSQNDQLRVKFLYSLTDSSGKLIILCSHIVKSSMWLYMLHFHSMHSAESIQRSQLIQHICLCLCRTHT